MYRWTTLILAMAATAAVSAATPAANPKSTPVPAHEPTTTSEIFVEQATLAGMFEVDAGKIALTRSSDPAVRDFAQKMVTDHSAANAELASIAKKAPPALPIPMLLDSDHKAKLEKLEKTSGKNFDAAYGQAMRDGHDQAVVLFTHAAGEPLVRPELREFASKTLPALQAHQAEAAKLPVPAKKQ